MGMRSVIFALLLSVIAHAHNTDELFKEIEDTDVNELYDFSPAVAHQPMPQLLPAHVKQMNTASVRRMEPNIPLQINVVEKGDREFTKALKKIEVPTNAVEGEKIGGARWGVSANLNANRAKSGAVYSGVSIPDIPARPQGTLDKNPVKQGFSSPEFKAQSGATGTLARSLAALLIGSIVGS